MPLAPTIANDVARLDKSQRELRDELAELRKRQAATESVIEDEIRPELARLDTELIGAVQRMKNIERVLLEVQGEQRNAYRAVLVALSDISEKLGVQPKAVL